MEAKRSAEKRKHLVYKYLILYSACVPSNRIANSGRFNGEFRYLSVTCPKGKDRAYSTYKDYCLRRRRLAAFLEYEYHVIPFKELKRDFIEKFVVCHSTVKGPASGTINAGGGGPETASDDLYGV